MELEKGLITFLMKSFCAEEPLFPGTITFEDQNGTLYPVDFHKIKAMVDKVKPNVIRYKGVGPAKESFTAIHEIASHIEDIRKITECYVTQYGETPIEIQSITELKLYLSGCDTVPKNTPYFTFEEKDGLICCTATKELLESAGPFINEE